MKEEKFGKDLDSMDVLLGTHLLTTLMDVGRQEEKDIYYQLAISS